MIQRVTAAIARGIARTRSGQGERYSRAFYVEHGEIGRRSAEVVVPIVVSLVQPRSVVDVGCGSGSWLSVFEAHGVEDILGIDSEDVPADVLAVRPSAVLRRDLRRPLALDRRFDLVVCLEVGEHLPTEAAEGLITSLTGLGPLVLFSAAIPHQGGIGHVNEQWPDYWAEAFARRGFVAIDCLRRKLWSHPGVAWWYAQNTLLFAERRALAELPRLRAELELIGASQLSIVHPHCYMSKRRALRQLF